MARDKRGSGGTPPGRARAFLERARLEADRYGPDPWIFVRELLQNSRDAGATQVAFMVHEGDGREVVACRDDGEGMSFEHARRYLFALYASSKEDAKNQAGKFGVGFWSVLRFEPDTITIRSRPRNGPGWGLRLEGSLESATSTSAYDRRGTEITLTRHGGDGRLEHRVFDAVWQSARYLNQRDAPDRPVTVTVNGRPAMEAFALPAPSAAFRRGSVRGVVGLGPAPRVELFSRGLRVRAAACLEDLLASSGRHTGRMRVQFPELPGGLAPQALLESDRLEVMLSRSDARENRALGRLVRLAQRELERLVDRQLAQARPQPWWRRIADWFGTQLRQSILLRSALGSAVGLCVALGLAWLLWGDGVARHPSDPLPVEPPGALAIAGGDTLPAVRPYRDLGTRYRGPRVDVLTPGSAEPIDLEYEPAALDLHFASMRFAELAADGSPVGERMQGVLDPYVGVPCSDGCVDVALSVQLDRAPMRLPVPSGHRVVDDSVTLDGEPLPVLRSATGHPVVRVATPGTGVLRYRTVAAPDGEARVPPRGRVDLPDDLRSTSRRLQTRPVQERVDLLTRTVQGLVRYDRTPEVAESHVEAARRGAGFLERTLQIGAGDCDIQNGLLVALLHEAGVPARLAVGYLGRGGEALPFLHAWVEWQGEDGHWRIADASDSRVSVPTAASLVPPPPGPPPVAFGVAQPVQAGDAEDDPAPAFEGETPSVSVAAAAPEDARALESVPTSEAVVGAPAIPSGPPVEPLTVEEESSSFFAFVWALDRRSPWILRGLPVMLAGLALGSLFAGRTRRAIKLDAGADLSRLLRGVLQQPGAFGHVSSLFNRPLVPLCGGRAISINRARALATLSQLYRSRNGSGLARRAAKARAAVLDEGEPEGQTVADALGAVDLDRWDRLLQDARADALCRSVNDLLATRGEDWGMRISSSVPGGLAVLDLGPLGVRLPGHRGSRLVLVDERATWLMEARTLARTAPARATLQALDHLTAALSIPTARRARLLGECARRAIHEFVG